MQERRDMELRKSLFILLLAMASTVLAASSVNAAPALAAIELKSGYASGEQGPLVGVEVELLNCVFVDHWLSAGEEAFAVGYFIYFPVDEPLRLSLSVGAGLRAGVVDGMFGFLTLGADYEMDWFYVGADISGGLDMNDTGIIHPFYMLQIKAGVQYHF